MGSWGLPQQRLIGEPGRGMSGPPWQQRGQPQQQQWQARPQTRAPGVMDPVFPVNQNQRQLQALPQAQPADPTQSQNRFLSAAEQNPSDQAAWMQQRLERMQQRQPQQQWQAQPADPAASQNYFRASQEDPMQAQASWQQRLERMQQPSSGGFAIDPASGRITPAQGGGSQWSAQPPSPYGDQAAQLMQRAQQMARMRLMMQQPQQPPDSMGGWGNPQMSWLQAAPQQPPRSFSPTAGVASVGRPAPVGPRSFYR